MFNLKFVIYFICFFIFVHFGLHFFDIDIFELFEKKEGGDSSPYPADKHEHSNSQDDDNEISNTIYELEKSIQELKDVSTI